MRLINADALSKSVLEWLPSDPCGRPEAEHPFETDICVSMLMEIEDAPTIDAVPVVRCDECEKQSYCHQTVGKTKRHDGFIEYWAEEIEWCSKGVRRGGSEA